MVVEAGCDRAHVLYVGDRLDNDIAPAQNFGIQTALIRRGPWGRILRDQAVEDRCRFDLVTLDPLPELVQRHNVQSRD
jgi:FMN phosphatase YigB (HAD superfamily)